MFSLLWAVLNPWLIQVFSFSLQGLLLVDIEHTFPVSENTQKTAPFLPFFSSFSMAESTSYENCDLGLFHILGS